jgi:cytosine/adenosine deaminase-related metal-dependent hydrolase
LSFQPDPLIGVKPTCAALATPGIARSRSRSSLYTAIRRSFKGKINCGHCCSLAVQQDEVVAETLALCRDAGIAVVSLPMCNLYLQDRVPGRTPI